MNLLLPSSLDLDYLASKFHDQKRKYKPNVKLKKDEIAIIYYTIIRRYLFNRREYIKSGFVRLQSKILERYSKKYREIIELLVNEGFITVDETYISGERSKGYAIITNKLDPNLKLYEITSNKLIKYTESKPNNNPFKFNHLDKLKHWIEQLQLDENKANKWLESSLTDNKLDILKYTENRLKIHQFINQSPYFKLDNTAGRLHTSITTFKKELRQFLTIKGQRLEEIDIHNCQPLVSLILFNSKMRKAYGIEVIIKRHMYNRDKLTNLPYMFSKIDELSCKPDALLFYQKVSQGQFYNYLVEQFNKDYPNIKKTEKEFKKMVLKCLFSPSLWDSKVSRLIHKVFPSIMEAFDLIKLGFNKTKNGKGKMKRKSGDPPCLLAIVLQKLEAELVLNRIVPEIISLYPEAPIITIHDAILTTPKYIQVIDQLITKHINNITNQFKI